MGVFNLYLYIYIPTVGIDHPFQAFQIYVCVVNCPLQFISYEWIQHKLFYYSVIALCRSNVHRIKKFFAQLSIAREIHQAKGKKIFYYVCQHKSVVLKSRMRILS